MSPAIRAIIPWCGPSIISLRSRDFKNDALDQMNLTALEYQTIGENVVARLLALNGRTK